MKRIAFYLSLVLVVLVLASLLRKGNENELVYPPRQRLDLTKVLV